MPQPPSPAVSGAASGFTAWSPARQGAVVFAAVWLAVAALVRLPFSLPLVGHVGSALVALIFLYVPSEVARRRGEDLIDYGFALGSIRRGLGHAALAMLLLFPLFALGTLAFYEVACKTDLAALAPAGLCARYQGLDAIHAPALDLRFLEFCAVQLVVVALPEELFFRGMLLSLWSRAWPARRQLAGVPIGWAVVLSAAAFAVVHLPRDGDPRALATFFPGLLFAYLRLRTGSLLAPILTHAGANILIRLLDLSLLG